MARAWETHTGRFLVTTPTNPDYENESFEVETVDFSTPTHEREIVKTPLTLCGETYAVIRPNDAALFFLSAAYSDSGTDADTFMTLVQWVEANHTVQHHARFLQ